MVGRMRQPNPEKKMNFLDVSRRHFFRQGLGLSSIGLSTLLASDSPMAQEPGVNNRSFCEFFSLQSSCEVGDPSPYGGGAIAARHA